jgi:hypothetical protein
VEKSQIGTQKTISMFSTLPYRLIATSRMCRNRNLMTKTNPPSSHNQGKVGWVKLQRRPTNVLPFNYNRCFPNVQKSKFDDQNQTTYIPKTQDQNSNLWKNR